MIVSFGLNHQTAPFLSLKAFFALATELGLRDVEIRNDLPTPLQDSTPAPSVKELATADGLRVASINALQRFNDWNDVRHQEAEALIGYARSCGAAAVVLCPVNDTAFRPDHAARLHGLRTALDHLAPLLRASDLIGLVEPLGFAECSLRLKREAVDAIDAVGGGDVFRLVHDTFHHRVSGETALFPDRTGLVHISGVDDETVPLSRMRDGHRVLVDEKDRIDNVGQIKALLAGGYRGILSFEPFADSIAQMTDVKAAIAASMIYLERGVAG